jgi:uncharacterized membrane protein YfcA
MGMFEFAMIGLAAVAGGLVNALAGGGTLITFPILIAVGVPPVAANVTNTVALCPGYLGATCAQMKDLRDQKRTLLFLLPTGLLGGIAGGNSSAEFNTFVRAEIANWKQTVETAKLSLE